MAEQSTNKYEVGALVRKLESQYQTGETTISKHVTFNLLENIEKVDAYTNSKHTTGDQDSLGRDKPFFNIVTSAINIWYRATDIDRRNIGLKATRLKDVTRVFIARMKIQQWMRDENFGAFLNRWGRVLSKHGSAVLKFVEKNGKLIPMVLDWNKVIIDPVSFYDNPVIEPLDLTPAQLRKRKGYDQEVVEELIRSAQQARETADGQDKDTRANYIRVYEIHGELSKAYLTQREEDADEYIQQMHVVAFVETKEGEKQDFTLAKGKEAKSPYMITHLIPEDNRSKAIGAVEHLFEAQWMQNHTVKAIKDHLDLASRLIFQTADDTFLGQNALQSIETGDILVHKDDMPLTQVNNSSHDITQFQNFGSMWKQLGNEIVGISEAMQGTTPKSGTAWRQTEAVLAESHDLFELMTENKGLYIEEMFRKFVLPYIKKQLKNSDEIIGVLEDHDIRMIDAKLVDLGAEKKVKQDIINSLVNGQMPVGLDVEATRQNVQQEISSIGNLRSFVPSEVESKTWEEYFDGMVWETEVDVTAEASNSNEQLTTLNTVLATIAKNPNILQDPNAKMLFNKILAMTNAVSPIEMQDTPSPVANPSVETPQVGPTPEAVNK